MSRINDTGDKVFAGVVDTSEQLIADVVDTHSFANISANFRKNSNSPNGILGGPENLVLDSF
jgi:hypothetical protein